MASHPVNRPRYLDPEILPRQAIVTLNQNQDHAVRPVFFTGQVFGTVDILQDLASALDRTVYGIQGVASDPDTCVEDVAELYIKHMKQKQPKGPYDVVGYSYGAGTAFEMATQLQEAGEDCSLVLLDSGPRTGGTFVKELMSVWKSDDEVDAAVIQRFIIGLKPGDKSYESQVLSELRGKTTHDERGKVAVEAVHRLVTSADPKDIFTAMEKSYRRFFMAYEYEPKVKLKSKVTLIKSSNPYAFFLIYGPDYGLGMDCTGQIDMHTVEGVHGGICLGETAPVVAKLVRDALQRE